MATCDAGKSIKVKTILKQNEGKRNHTQRGR